MSSKLFYTFFFPVMFDALFGQRVQLLLGSLFVSDKTQKLQLKCMRRLSYAIMKSNTLSRSTVFE